MRKFASAAIAGVMLATAAASTPANALAPPPPPAGAAASAGAWWVGGFIGIVAALDLYDIIRRTTCSGDFLNLGGPGFTSAITPPMNVLPPQCRPPRR
jgi:hypothetical protein